MRTAPPPTDYARIAPDYDADRTEFDSFDTDLSRALEAAVRTAEARGCPPLLVDVACGTGTVLARLEKDGPERLAGWRRVGVDASEAMIRIAVRKSADAPLAVALAERLPLRTSSAGCVLSTFAFHHFQSLAGFLSEAGRVLAGGGQLVLRNIFPREQEGMLLYRFFPAARDVDARRFPLRSELLGALAAAQFCVTQELSPARVHEFTPARFAGLCRKRTISQLDLISVEQFEAGMAELEALARSSPGVRLIENVPVHTFVAERV